MKQLKLFKEIVQREFGGGLLKGKRKTRRPLNFKLPHHLVLKSNSHCLLLKERKQVEAIIRQYSKNPGVNLTELAVQTDHVHLTAQFASREVYTRWIRSVTAVLSMKIPGLSWSLRPYSRTVSRGRELWTVIKYIRSNQREADFILNAHDRVEAWRLWAITSRVRC